MNFIFINEIIIIKNEKDGQVKAKQSKKIVYDCSFACKTMVR
jgi:hypothetical protein